ncbi:hypothetical protein F8388_014415 [Cannabis sativa]|uniref:DUF4408 domain-containing protein n=1 Tax=Cannabis sativa TaxID=3483 RepID=A0A7J6FY57_CANSA|nr:hypothetical protein F8388_014415 [Cannabis sativa]
MFEDSVSSIPTIWASINSWFTPTILFLFLNLMIATIFITSSLNTPKPNPNPNQQQQHHRLHPQLVRSPSVLQRLKSINFYTYRSQEPTTHFQKNPSDSDEEHTQTQTQTHLFRSPSVLQKLKSINLYSYLSPPQYQNPNQEQTHFEEHSKTLTSRLQFDEEDTETLDQFDQSMDDVYSKLKNNGGAHVVRSNSDTKPSNGEAPPKLSKKMKKSASAKSAFSHFNEDDIVESRRPATVREGKAKVVEKDEEEEGEVDAKADDFINRFKQQLKLQRLDSIVRYKEMIGRGAGH